MQIGSLLRQIRASNSESGHFYDESGDFINKSGDFVRQSDDYFSKTKSIISGSYHISHKNHIKKKTGNKFLLPANSNIFIKKLNPKTNRCNILINPTIETNCKNTYYTNQYCHFSRQIGFNISYRSFILIDKHCFYNQ